MPGLDERRLKAELRLEAGKPAREIGVAAMTAMLNRLQHPDLPPRETLLHGELVVRASA